MTTKSQFDYTELAKYLTKQQEGRGKCLYAAIHGQEDGDYWGGDPHDIARFTNEEVKVLNKVFIDPTMLFSSGISLRGNKFTFLKVEGDAILSKSRELGCIIMKTHRAFIITIFKGNEWMKNVYEHMTRISNHLKEASQ